MSGGTTVRYCHEENEEELGGNGRKGEVRVGGEGNEEPVGGVWVGILPAGSASL
jgi:hypothetical protein